MRINNVSMQNSFNKKSSPNFGAIGYNERFEEAFPEIVKELKRGNQHEEITKGRKFALLRIDPGVVVSLKKFFGGYGEYIEERPITTDVIKNAIKRIIYEHG